MSEGIENHLWPPGCAPVAVVMISLNEAHNMREVLQNLKGWAQEVFLLDSCSSDLTVDIALQHGVSVIQRKFQGFGDQWNFALNNFPITAPYTMKLDPDERLSLELKAEILRITEKRNEIAAYTIPIRLFFMGERLPSVLNLTRLWKTGSVRFSDVKANEHALTDGPIGFLRQEIEHHDSPCLDHWMIKQNRYTTTEAISQFQEQKFSVEPSLFNGKLARRMWLKRNFWNIPGRFFFLFLYHYLIIGAWRVGKVGWVWSHLRTEVYRIWEYKLFEIKKTKRLPIQIPSHSGGPDPRVRFYE